MILHVLTVAQHITAHPGPRVKCKTGIQHLTVYWPYIHDCVCLVLPKDAYVYSMCVVLMTRPHPTSTAQHTRGNTAQQSLTWRAGVRLSGPLPAALMNTDRSS